MLVAALRRLAFVTALALGVTVVLSLIIGLLIGASVNRSLTLGFYLGGCFLLVVGFFVGNRGPARIKGDDTIGPTMLPVPGTGARRLRWATLTEQTRDDQQLGRLHFARLDPRRARRDHRHTTLTLLSD